MPEFDREGGSRRIFHLIEFLQQAGWVVSFAAESAYGAERYARELQQRGIAVYVLYDSWRGGENALTDMELLVHAERFDLALFAFWNCAEPHIPTIRSVSPETTILIDSVDVHFLRNSRRAFTSTPQNGQPHTLDPEYGTAMQRELNVYAAGDAVLTVSRKEADLINDFVGAQVAWNVPDADDISPSATPFAERNGMLFIGNFRHPPNVQAVQFLCDEVLPEIPPAILDEHPIYIVGNEPTDAIRQCSKNWKNVRVVGWVPSVLPYLQGVRLSLIPLLYGAGTKRKLMQSMMAGTPSVSTSIGIEGLDLLDDRHVLVADDATSFASDIVRLLTDQASWERIAREGMEYITKNHSREAAYSRFSAVLAEVMRRARGAQPNVAPSVPANPVRAHTSIFCEELQPGAHSKFDNASDQTARQEALRDRTLTGFCNVASAETEFTVSSDNFREGVVARVSSSINRHRQLVCALSMGLFGHPDAPLGEIAERANQNRLKVYIAETNSVLSNALRQWLAPGLLVCSEYVGPEYRSGETVHGILNEDLQRTSFRDEEFDVVITSEVFEHIPDAISAEREVMRILKPGGVYCFTVPFLPVNDHDLVLAEVDANGNTKHLAPPQYHEDPLRPEEGILVYRLFSFHDLKRRFEEMGHEFKSYRFWSRRLGILGSDCWAHTVKKNRAHSQ
jgi:glycosyltransferase involved in cell wall biosynthesis/SAM-dependent methyltransferase